MFCDREAAARQLAEVLKGRKLHDPVVLAIPRGGVVTGAVLARELGADLDVVLSRKLRAPGKPELAIGAIAEDGRVYLNHHSQAFLERLKEHLAQEGRLQLAEIGRRKKLFRGARPKVPLQGRSVIVTDDGIATGATMIAALKVVQTQNAREVLVAVPVASPERLVEVRRWCDDVVCLLAPESFLAIGQFYEDFTQVGDEEVIELLREFAPCTPRRATGARSSKVITGAAAEGPKASG
jgi:predicted phosphoribosyltransferase